MSCREIVKRLDDFLDGRLNVAERQRVREHLAHCLACSRELAGLRRLQGRAVDLPGVAPGHDLWPAIRQRIRPAGGETSVAGAPDGRSGRARRWWPLAAAATLGLAVLLPRLADRATESPRRLLTETLEERRGDLPPESLEVFESNLAILDRAILEIEGALEASPENRRLRLLLAQRHQQEAELLKLLARA